MGMGYAPFGSDITLQKKRVRWYNRESSAEVIYEGQPVCYMYDTTDNILGYDKGAGGHPECQTSPDTTAEGYLNEGKFLIVEKPETDNLQWFAGVVAPGSWVGKSIAATSNEWIDIYIPNGQIVPVRAGVECTVGRTVLGIAADQQYLGHPGTGRSVAVAEETNATLDSTNGLILAKLAPDQFIYQHNTDEALLMGVGATAPATSQILNWIYADSGHTGGDCVGLFIQQSMSGTVTATGGGMALLSYLGVTGTITATTTYVRTTLNQLVMSGTINSTNTHLTACHCQVGGSPTFTQCSKLVGMWVDLGMGVTPTSGDYVGIRISNNGSNQTEVDYGIEFYGGYGINYIFNFDTCAGITGNFISNGGTGGSTTWVTSGGDWKKLKVAIDGTDYFLVAMVNPAESS